FKEQGKLDDALACYRQALEVEPGFAAVHSNLLYTLHYCQGLRPAELAAAHAEFDRRHAAPLYVRLSSLAGSRRGFSTRENVHDRHGPLRLGFVSPDLGQHPVG